MSQSAFRLVMVDRAGRRVLLVPGDIADPGHCRAVILRAVGAFGRVDVLVNNAAFQMDTRVTGRDTGR